MILCFGFYRDIMVSNYEKGRISPALKLRMYYSLSDMLVIFFKNIGATSL